MIGKYRAWIIPGCLLAVVLYLVLVQFMLPEPLPTSAPLGQFSAGRAIEILEPIALAPHPAGSPAQAAVRESLVQQLSALGFEVEVQSTTGVLSRYQVAGRVNNIVGRLQGKDTSGAILLMAHYDSVPQGPGAGDNGAGVVTILESLRALQADRPLKNDLIVLFTDAEEYGILGAQAFIQQHPLMDGISLVLNIEGTLKGSVVLVETGPENGWFVRNFRQASPHAMGYSWLYDLFGMMPNLTDFMPFREAGLAGGNLFSFNGGPYYHTPLDTTANLDVRSLQQHGEQTLALIEHFAQADLEQTHAGNVTYFNLVGNLMVIYPAAWSLPLAALTFLFITAAVIWAIREKRISLRGLLIGIPAALLSLIAGPLLAAVLWHLTQQAFPMYKLYFPAHIYQDGWYAAAFTAAAAGLTMMISRLLLRRPAGRETPAGGLVLLAGLGVVVSIFAPGFSYLFTWPTLLAAAAWLTFLAQGTDQPWLTSAGWTLLTAPSVLLWLPVGLILFWSTGLDFLPAIAFTAVFPLTLVSPFLENSFRRRGWIIPACFGAISVACFLVAAAGSAFTAEHPLPLRVQYFYNISTGEACWINPDAPLTAWQAQFTMEGYERTSWAEIFPPFQSTILKSPAPEFSLNPSRVSILEDSLRDGLRTIRLSIAPGQAADQLILSLPPETDLIDLTVDGMSWTDRAGADAGWQTFYFVAPPAEGVRIQLVTAGRGPAEFLVMERAVGLENLPGNPVLPRPAEIITLGDYLYVYQTIMVK